MSIISKWAMSGAVGCLLIAVPLAAYYVVKHKLKGVNQDHAKISGGQHSYLMDLTAVNSGHTCVCCGAVNTHLLPVANDEWQCADRRLCRETMIYTHMLKGLESA